MIDLMTDQALDIYWRDHCEHGVIAAKSSYRHVIEHLKKHFGAIATNAISTTDVYEYCRKRRAGVIGMIAGNGTLNRELRMLLTAIRFAAKALRIPEAEVMPEITSAFPKPPKGMKEGLPQEEMDFMLEVAKAHKEFPSRIYRFCMIGFYCGARKEAILQLKPKEQINLKTGLINFNTPGRSQTSKNRPIVPIADELMPLMEEVVSRGDEYFCVHPGSIRPNFEWLVKKCGFDKERNITPHILRHTYAIQALQNGVSIWDVANVLGDDPQTVKDHYGQYCPTFLRDAVNFRKRK